MQLINLTAEAAEDALVRLARDVEPGIELGRPLAAHRNQGSPEPITTIITDLEPAVTWQVFDRGGVCRTLTIRPGVVEFTVYIRGRETDREIGYAAQ